MIIEQEVLDRVAEYLCGDGKAYFYSHTLWLETNEETARRVFSMLFSEYDGEVAVNKVGKEYAIDFI